MMATASPPPTEPIEYALRYAGVGLRVVPIKPGHKRPDLPAWQRAATTDRATIESWWTGLYRDHGVGLALGELEDYATTTTWIFAVDVDQHGVDGGAMLAELEAHHGELPTTVEATTGGGGRHLLFSADHEIRNGKLCDGVDIRGAGGQIVVEPSIHPSGQPYHWVIDQAPWEHPIAPAPAWLLDRLAAVPEAPPRTPAAPTVAVDAGSRPGDLWAAETTWYDLLTADGWTHAGRGGSGEEQWVRPGKTVRDGISATVGYGGSDVLKVFTTSHPQLNAEETYTKLGYLAATRHGGDHGAAARALRAEGWHAPDEHIDVAGLIGDGARGEVAGTGVGVGSEEGGWPVASAETLQAIIDGDYEPVRPDLLRRTDGAFLLYSGKVNSVAAEPGSGKTWIALKAAHDVLEAGGKVVWIDWEDRVDTAVRRLRQLGTDRGSIVGQFKYVEPTFAIKGGVLPSNVIDLANDAELVVIDSMGEALAHARLNQNDDGEVGGWMAGAARPLARGGAAVVIIDHMVKKKDDQGRFAIGSQRKLAGITGIAYTANVLAAASIDKPGRLVLKVSKDRHGNYPHGSTAAEIGINPTDGGGVHIAITTPDGAAGARSEKLLTHLMQKVSLLLEDQPEGMSLRALQGSISSRREHVSTAARQLVEHGFAESVGSGPRAAIVSVTRYREPSDLIAEPVDKSSDSVENATAPTAPLPRPGRGAISTAPTAPAAPLPYGEGGLGGARWQGASDDSETTTAPRPRPDWI